MAGLDCETITLDALLVALDSRGRVVGCPLEMLCSGRTPTRVQLRVLDLLAHEGAYVQGLPYAARRQRLRGILPVGDNSLTLIEELSGSVKAMLELALSTGQAGVIAKRADASYEEGLRSGAWVKYRLTPGIEAVRPLPARKVTRVKDGIGVNDSQQQKAA